MGTRGSLGFRVNGQDMLTYNHYDSGPEWLGQTLMKEIRVADATVLKAVPSRLQIVESEKRPTKKQLEGCYMYLRQEVEGTSRLETYEEMVQRLDDRNVGGPGRHWYKVLRQTQGTFAYMLGGLPFFIGHGADFLHQSDCEWAYIVNLDTAQFEIYTGHWNASRAERDYYPVLKPQGRYAKGENGEVEGWGGVQLIEAIALDELAEASDEAITRYCKRLDRSF